MTVEEEQLLQEHQRYAAGLLSLAGDSFKVFSGRLAACRAEADRLAPGWKRGPNHLALLGAGEALDTAQETGATAEGWALLKYAEQTVAQVGDAIEDRQKAHAQTERNTR